MNELKMIRSCFIIISLSWFLCLPANSINIGFIATQRSRLYIHAMFYLETFCDSGVKDEMLVFLVFLSDIFAFVVDMFNQIKSW